MTARKTICPYCFHGEEMLARQHGHEEAHDDPALMTFHRPHGGPRGQVVTRWDGGWWECELCGLRLTPHETTVLLDAVLKLALPDCDSIDPNTGFHGDVVTAANCGRVES